MTQTVAKRRSILRECELKYDDYMEENIWVRLMEMEMKMKSELLTWCGILVVGSKMTIVYVRTYTFHTKCVNVRMYVHQQTLCRTHFILFTFEHMDFSISPSQLKVLKSFTFESLKIISLLITISINQHICSYWLHLISPRWRDFILIDWRWCLHGLSTDREEAVTCVQWSAQGMQGRWDRTFV